MSNLILYHDIIRRFEQCGWSTGVLTVTFLTSFW